MDSLETGQILVLSLVVAAPFLGVALENSGKRLGRTHYIGWFVVAVIANALSNMAGKQGLGASGLDGIVLWRACLCTSCWRRKVCSVLVTQASRNPGASSLLCQSSGF